MCTLKQQAGLWLLSVSFSYMARGCFAGLSFCKTHFSGIWGERNKNWNCPSLGPLLTLENWCLHFSCFIYIFILNGFPHSSVGKEPACNAGDPGSVPELGRFAGEGIGYPLQYSRASLVAQLVKNPTMRETWVWSLIWEDPPEKGKATHSSILAWRIPGTI